MKDTTIPSGPSLTRILRIIAIVFAVAGLVFGALLIPSVLAQESSLLGWWDVLALSLVFGLPVLMGLVAPWSSATTIRRLAGSMAIGQLLVMATWMPAMTVRALPPTANSAWVLGATAIGTTAAALAWRARFVWIYLAATSLLLVVDRALGSPQPAAIPLQDALYGLMFDSIFAALALVTVSAGSRLDNAAESARVKTTRAATGRAQSRERSRVNALMHDGVLATLLVAAQDDSALRAAAANQARKTLEQIDEFTSGRSSTSSISGLDFVWLQQATTTEIDPEAEFSYELENTDIDLPAEVGVAFTESLAEALRNVLRHAATPGEELHRAVHARVADSHAEVMVLDDGVGFDPTRVAASRLGIAVSIRDRMDLIAGGSSQVVSSIGQGTRIVLSWQKP
ncbi:MAG: ATP-binding protein [Glaciihabitans sp.]|nr:ATP-binding protein [Glaciihabitans sp.]